MLHSQALDKEGPAFLSHREKLFAWVARGVTTSWDRAPAEGLLPYYGQSK
jgi:hypothetical protein